MKKHKKELSMVEDYFNGKVHVDNIEKDYLYSHKAN